MTKNPETIHLMLLHLVTISSYRWCERTNRLEENKMSGGDWIDPMMPATRRPGQILESLLDRVRSLVRLR